MNRRDVRTHNRRKGSKTLRHNPAANRPSTITEFTRDRNGKLNLASTPLSLNKNKRWEAVKNNPKVFVHKEGRHNHTKNVINNFGMQRDQEPNLEDMTIHYEYVHTRQGKKAVPIDMPKISRKKLEGAKKAQNHSEKVEDYQGYETVHIVNIPNKRVKKYQSYGKKDHYQNYWESNNPNHTEQSRNFRYQIMETM
eukprot:TRINITY_DN12205_c0_g1_i1.p1 TRINITY_DN12205_c0_g1~~TRINITY_DN12205_c0_g1_i1.p1  ORF type:complete len:203 (-),score=24.34 TRINITY_DN12205_c0_g1_i1:66-650(-)